MSLSIVKLPSVSRPSRPKLPGPGAWQDIPSTGIPVARAVEVDEYGLNNTVFGRLPKVCRRYVAIALRHYGKPLNQAAKGFATLPELVMLGILLDRGFQSQSDTGNRSFTFQSPALGGRQPGGSVVDVSVNYGGERIAVRVQSSFHALASPFGQGGVKTEEDANRLAQLESHGLFSRVVDVNRVEDGKPLEQGPPGMVERDYLRVIGQM